MNVETRQLRYFIAVAEELHFGRAALRLRMAQPPLSQAIRALESALGAKLFDRTTRRVTLTAAGDAFLSHARELLAHLDRATEEASRISCGLEGRLVIGCVGSASYSLLPKLARELRAQRPGLLVEVRGEMMSEDQASALRDGTIDVGLLRQPCDASELTLTRVRTDRLMVAVSEDHLLADRKTLSFADLANETVITHASHSYMHRLVRELISGGVLAPNSTQEVSETSTALTFVAASLGVAILPEPARALGIAGVRWLELNSAPTTDLHLGVRSKDQAENAAASVAAAVAAAVARLVQAGRLTQAGVPS